MRGARNYRSRIVSGRSDDAAFECGRENFRLKSIRVGGIPRVFSHNKGFEGEVLIFWGECMRQGKWSRYWSYKGMLSESK